MGVIRNISLVTCSIIAIIILTVLIATVASKIILYPSFYKTSFEEANLYDEIEARLLNQTGVSGLSLPKESIETFVNDGLVNILAYIRSDTDILVLNLIIDESVIRESLLSQLEGLPVCADGIVPYQGAKFVCLPEGITAQQYIEIYLSDNQILQNVKSVDLAQTPFLEEGSQARESINRIRELVDILRILVIIYVIALLVIGALLFFLMPSPKRDVIEVFGIIMLVSAGFVYAISVIIGLIESQSLGLEDPLVQSLVSAAIKQLLTQYVYYASITGAGGLILIFFGILIHKKRKEKKQIRKLEKENTSKKKS